MIEAGKILQNRYRIEKHIGQGGMGRVYIASDQRFNSTVAIKQTVFEEKSLRRAFEREARLLNSLKHLALPGVSDHFTEEEGQFLVMEYIPGEDLAEMMERRGAAFPLEEVLNWANQLTDALSYLHSLDIIHRDIKPQNLKLTPTGQIVLLDFGLAKGNPTDAQNVTAAKSIFGYSRNYASLEQIQGTGTEPRSDLYSLSATLYHLLTGVPPADALTRAMNVLNKHPDPLIPANLINNKLPRGVAEILQKTMALNASERPESAEALRLMLENCEKALDSDELSLVGVAASSAEFLTQETKIKSPVTNSSKENPSQIATKIISENTTDEKSFHSKPAGPDAVSKITQLRSTGNTNLFGRSKTAVAGTALGGLLLIGTALSAMYLYKPAAAPNPDENFGSANSSASNKFVITAPANTDFSNSNAAVANSNSETVGNNKAIENNTKLNSAQTAKNQSKSAKNQSKNNQPNSGSGKNETDPNQMIVNEDSVETRDMIIDENGIRMKNKSRQRNPRINPPTPPTVFKQLTPEQIRKLEQLKNLNPRTIIVNPPIPKTTP